MKKPSRNPIDSSLQELEILLLSEIQKLSGVCAIIFGEDGEILFQSPNLGCLLETGENTLQREVLIERTDPDDRRNLLNCIESQTPQEITFHLDLPSGRELIVKARSSRINAGLYARTLFLMQDVSEIHRLKKRVELTDHLHALDLLAVHLAHDMNNMLAIIIGNLSDIDPSRFNSNEDVVALNSALEAAERGPRITQLLESLATRQPGPRLNIDLRSHLRGMLPVISYLLGKKTKVIDALGKNSYVIEADPVALNRAILNVLINARESTPEVGEFKIKLIHSKAGSGQVKLEFIGSGIEIEPKRLEGIDIHAGDESDRELGLSKALCTMQALGGHLRVTRRIGNGFTVTLEFPLAS